MLQSEKLKLLVIKYGAKALNFRYHYISNKVAFKALKEVEKEKGKLNSKSKKLAKKYAIDILGWKGYAPWLYLYTHIYGEFREGWLPDNYYGKIVIPKIQGDYGKVSNLKPFTNTLFNSHVCPDLAYFVNGQWFSNEFKPLSPQQVEKLISQNQGKVVYKSDYTYQGRGVFVYDNSNFDVNMVANKGNGVLQVFIQQHEFFNEFGSDAVATLRMTTVIDNSGNSSFRACFLRLGRVNHTHVKSHDQILVPVDTVTGELQERGYFTSYKSTLQHPDSQVGFLNKTIPNFNECIRLVLQLQGKMPMVRTIGWDLVVNKKNKPVIMEWNGYGSGICFSEATQGPSFKDLNWNVLHKE
ncbi:sugar-transfer associated ATP-grasp domain-containing protein [Ulvibacterium marinum]|uniref:sugar-transfer associated ATP-grasp domain-containing protein n=1 Tax=Ulvibacterium marinum TaxID=2419782 RepID=UPI00249404DD|nr:sugar-transfer associated ATP-grasp domain-containing protein [Ulvibacterium marinum]